MRTRQLLALLPAKTPPVLTFAKADDQFGGQAQWGTPAVADVDGDGRLEVIMVGKSSTLQLWRCTSGRLHQVGSITLDANIGESVLVADINADGKQELVVCGFTAGTYEGHVEVWQWDGTTPTKLASTGWGTNGLCWCVATGHLGGAAGAYQIAVSSWNGSAVRLRVYASDLSTFDEFAWTDVGSPGPNTWGQPPVIYDINNDGINELVTFGRDATQHAVANVWTWVPGTITRVKTVTPLPNTTSEWHSGLVTDINGDGVKEMVVGGWKLIGGVHHAWLCVYSLDLTTLLAEAAWTCAGMVDTEIWYMHTARFAGNGGVDDIAVFGGSYAAAGESFSAWRMRGAKLYRLYQQDIPVLPPNDSMVVEGGYVGDLAGDGKAVAFVQGWWSLALVGQGGTYSTWATTSAYSTPADLTGVILWLDASDAATLYQDSALTTHAVADADPVGGWKDKCGTGYNATQATAGKRLALKTATLNGKSTLLNASASSQVLVTPSVSHRILTGDFYVSAVVKTPATSATYRCIWNNGGAGQAPGLYVVSGKLDLYWTTDHNFSTTLAASTWYHVEAARSNGVVSSWVNGVKDATTFALATSMPDGTNDLTASGVGGGEGLNSNLAELVFAASMPTPAQQAAHQEYLRAKWALY